MRLTIRILIDFMISWSHAALSDRRRVGHTPWYQWVKVHDLRRLTQRPVLQSTKLDGVTAAHFQAQRALALNVMLVKCATECTECTECAAPLPWSRSDERTVFVSVKVTTFKLLSTAGRRGGVKSQMCCNFMPGTAWHEISWQAGTGLDLLQKGKVLYDTVV